MCVGRFSSISIFVFTKSRIKCFLISGTLELVFRFMITYFMFIDRCLFPYMECCFFVCFYVAYCSHGCRIFLYDKNSERKWRNGFEYLFLFLIPLEGLGKTLALEKEKWKTAVGQHGFLTILPNSNLNGLNKKKKTSKYY